MARGRLALDIVRERLRLTGVAAEETRFELIGVDSVHKGPVYKEPGHDVEPAEVRIRVAGRTTTMEEAVRIGREVETLYTNGPAGGGGVRKEARSVIGVVSTLLDRALAEPAVQYEVA